MSSNILLDPFILPSLSETPVIHAVVVDAVPRALRTCSFLFILFSSYSSDWVISADLAFSSVVFYSPCPDQLLHSSRAVIFYNSRILICCSFKIVFISILIFSIVVGLCFCTFFSSSGMVV